MKVETGACREVRMEDLPRKGHDLTFVTEINGYHYLGTDCTEGCSRYCVRLADSHLVLINLDAMIIPVPLKVVPDAP